MKSIKTRKSIKGIKVLDKSAALSMRMKDTFVRTREHAEERQNPYHNSPDDYASSNIQDTVHGAVRETIHHFPNPRHKARDNFERAKGYFQEIKNQMPKERQRTAEQAQQTAQKAKVNAEQLQKTSDKAVDSSQEAKQALHEAQQVLQKVKQNADVKSGVKKIEANAGNSPKGTCNLQGNSKNPNPARDRLVKNKQAKRYKVKSGKILRPNFSASEITPTQAQGGVKPQKSPSFTNIKTVNTIPATVKSLNTSTSNTSANGTLIPNYLNKGINTPKGASNVAKSSDKSLKIIKSARKSFKDTSKGTIKTIKKSTKTAEKSAKVAVKTAKQAAKAAQKTVQATAKSAKAAEKIARVAAKTAAQAAKAATKAVIAMVKVAIAAIKGLVALIAAGGWVAVAVILVICLVGLLVSSVFGIFFSSEPDPNTGKTVNSVIAEIDTEYACKIDNIIGSNTYDLLDVSGARAAWKQVLAVYTVKTVTDPDNPMEVATMNNEKAAILQTVFWGMNTITHTINTTTVHKDVLSGDGLPTGEITPVSKTVLRITVTHKTADETAAQYGFNNEQKEWLAELLKPEYHSLWNGLLYGITSIGDGSLIEIADTQIGNIGGEPYWRWYGFSNRVAWCACFVSWCAEQCGYINADVIPRFSLCDDGIRWFKNRGQWRNGGYTPVPGDIIFFDWERDGICDHVGIVERVNENFVHTIEGNTSDSCARRSYLLNDIEIIGYGVPNY